MAEVGIDRRTSRFSHELLAIIPARSTGCCVSQSCLKSREGNGKKRSLEFISLRHQGIYKLFNIYFEMRNSHGYIRLADQGIAIIVTF